MNPAKASPPQWAESVLRLVLDERSRDTITGDLLEEYRENILPERGVFRARFWYAWQAATLVAFTRRADMEKKTAWIWLASGLGLIAAGATLLARNGFAPPRLPWAAIAVPLALIAAALSSIRSLSDLVRVCKMALPWAALLILAAGIHALIPFDVERYFLAQARSGFSELEFPGRFAFGASIALILIGAGLHGAWKTSRVRTGILSSVLCAVVVVLPVSVVGGAPEPLVAAGLLGSLLGAVGAMLGKGIRGFSMKAAGIASSLMSLGLLGCGHANAISLETAKALAAMQFDSAKPVTVEGVITMIDFPNTGEGMLVLKSANAGYVFLTAGTPAMAKERFTRFTVHPGEQITVTGSLAQGGGAIDGLIAAEASKITSSDGRVLFDRSSIP